MPEEITCDCCNSNEIRKRETAAFYGLVDSLLDLIPEKNRMEAEMKIRDLQEKIIHNMDFGG